MPVVMCTRLHPSGARSWVVPVLLNLQPCFKEQGSKYSREKLSEGSDEQNTNLCTHPTVHSSIIYYCQAMEAT